MQPHLTTLASRQKEISHFAMFMFAWHLAYEAPGDTVAIPSVYDVEALARSAIRHFVSLGQGNPERLGHFVDLAGRALHIRYFYLPNAMHVSALDEIRSLITEELGSTPNGLNLQG